MRSPMKLIEVTETQDPLAESANYKEPIVLTRNGQGINAFYWIWQHKAI